MDKIDRIIEFTKKAIEESGKPFDKIPQDSILKFLSQNGVDKANTRMEIYKQLQFLYSTENKKSESKEAIKPGKEARKSVFGEIKRIA
jgi:hypothetical protein